MIVELLTIIYQTLLNKRKPLKIKEDMSIDQKEIEKGPADIYVWGKTERAGTIVVEDRDKSDEKFVSFTDGSRCARNLLSEMLFQARNQEDANKLALDLNPAANVTGNKDTKKTKDTPVKSNVQDDTPAEINVMMEMLRKMSAKNHANMPVKVNIPSKEVYDLFKDQMDITKKDLNNQIGLLVESQIDNLREQLKEQIESFIKNYYNGTTTKSSSTKS
jgi:hypothetical protein|tara:strand:+ start:4384 stop:5037 length:654 start_codon:yes stop_codon:yes gene_type:complete